VNVPVQVALPTLFEFRQNFQRELLKRVTSNRDLIGRILLNSPCSLLDTEGGWYAILQVPRIRSEEEWAIELLKEYGIYLFPGYFFDFHTDGYLVVSLLTPPEVLAPAIKKLVQHISR
jgi:aspartate/methionine/tyrosine aminotransferase